MDSLILQPGKYWQNKQAFGNQEFKTDNLSTQGREKLACELPGRWPKWNTKEVPNLWVRAVRNRASQQGVSLNAMLLYHPETIPPALLSGKTVFQETGPWCPSLGTAGTPDLTVRQHPINLITLPGCSHRFFFLQVFQEEPNLSTCSILISHVLRPRVSQGPRCHDGAAHAGCAGRREHSFHSDTYKPPANTTDSRRGPFNTHTHLWPQNQEKCQTRRVPQEYYG